MLTQIVWYCAIFLEALLLYRGFKGQTLLKFRLFYSYVSFVLIDELVRFVAYRSPASYVRVYWATQFLSLFVGCTIIFEIYRVGLKAFPGTARMARNLLFFVFAMVFAKAIVNVLNGASLLSMDSNLLLERNLRIAQSCALIALVVVFIFYAIPLSRNLRGILFGYGIFLGCSIIQLTIMDRFPEKIQAVWFYMQPVSYLIVLTVWAAALWNCSPEPVIDRRIRLEEDYRVLREATLRRFQRSRDALDKAVRS